MIFSKKIKWSSLWRSSYLLYEDQVIFSMKINWSSLCTSADLLYKYQLIISRKTNGFSPRRSTHLLLQDQLTFSVNLKWYSGSNYVPCELEIFSIHNNSSGQYTYRNTFKRSSIEWRYFPKGLQAFYQEYPLVFPGGRISAIFFSLLHPLAIFCCSVLHLPHPSSNFLTECLW